MTNSESINNEAKLSSEKKDCLIYMIKQLPRQFIKQNTHTQTQNFKVLKARFLKIALYKQQQNVNFSHTV